MESWKNQVLPLARIKKIMKSEEVIYQDDEFEKEREKDDAESSPQRFMIKGEAPVLMGKACELLIRDLTLRSWQHTERSRRRTLQKIDLQAAVGENEVYDYLVDIVPRLEKKISASAEGETPSPASKPVSAPFMRGGTSSTLSPLKRGIQGCDLNMPLAARPEEAGMTLADAEIRLAQLTKIHHNYIVMHQMQSNLSSGLHNRAVMPVPVQVPFLMSPHLNARSQWTSHTRNSQEMQENRDSEETQKLSLNQP